MSSTADGNISVPLSTPGLKDMSTTGDLASLQLYYGPKPVDNSQVVNASEAFLNQAPAALWLWLYLAKLLHNF